MKSYKFVVLFCLTCSIGVFGAAQEEKSKPRVFVSPSKSWEVSGGGGGVIGAAVGIAGGGGARPQTAEIIKTFEKRCPDVIVTQKQDKADYVIVLEHDGGKAGLSKDNKFVVFNRDGDSVKSGSTRTLGNAVKDACTALVEDWGEGKSKQ